MSYVSWGLFAIFPIRFNFGFIVRGSPSVSMDSRVPYSGSIRTIETMGGKVGSNCASGIIVKEEFKGGFCPGGISGEVVIFSVCVVSFSLVSESLYLCHFQMATLSSCLLEKKLEYLFPSRVYSSTDPL